MFLFYFILFPFLYMLLNNYMHLEHSRRINLKLKFTLGLVIEIKFQKAESES